jgi:chorismate mutase
MSSEAVTEILEEVVVPESVRGEQIAKSITMSGCSVIQVIDYENVPIMRSTHTCDPLSLEQNIRTAVTFKRDTCPKLSN